MSRRSPPPKPLTVIIVGGGIAGLTLANALQHAPVDIDYIVLEARDSLAPHLGAGIALVPNGSRVLDQLGVYADLEPGFDPIVDTGLIDAGGPASAPGAHGRRQAAGAPHVRHLRPAKGRRQVLTGKRVDTIQQDDAGATVYCTDGSSYHGDIVVGADGVRSKVRQEMWRASEEKGIGEIDVKKERKAMTAEYQCLFGVSGPVPGLGPGTSDDMWAQDLTVVAYSGERGKVFWFVYARMDRVYGGHELPRFTDADAARFAQRHLGVPLRPGGAVTFADVWRAREVATMLPLEEAHFGRWTAGRIVCLGDSVHKMTPHSGGGGMLCIETAAALANALCRLATDGVPGSTTPSEKSANGNGLGSQKQSTRFTLAQIQAALKAYETGPHNLHRRAMENIKASGDLGRLSALRTFTQRLLVPYLVPVSLDTRVDLFCDMAVGAPCIDYLPIPPRSMQGTMLFNPSHGLGKKENRWLRALFALPLLVLAVGCFKVLNGLLPVDHIRQVLDRGVYQPASGGAPVALLSGITGLPFVDSLTRIHNLEAVVCRENALFLLLTMHAEYGVWYAILLIESARRANYFSILAPAVFWGSAQAWGIASVASIYRFLHYVLSPIDKFDALDMRLTDLTYTKMVLPALALTHYASYLTAYLGPEPHRQRAGHLWMPFPLLLSLGQYLAARFLMKPSSVGQDRLYRPTRDVPVIRRTILCLVAVSAATWQYTLFWRHDRPSAADVFLPALPIPRLADLSLDAAYVELLKWDWAFFAASHFVWVALAAWDLKAAGMIRASWFALGLGAAAVALAGGPGAVLGLAWLYREEVLVTRRHKDAVGPKG
ncbi:FAD binding domain protein [Apiospora marii]|uniref:FAD binding domain protein n=1 Tax=Apiospora marii TaxID=335849 RepID=UPI00312DBBE6